MVSGIDLFTTACEHLSSGDPEGAESLIRRHLDADPDDARALHMLGILCHQRGAQPEAAAKLERAASIDPDSALYHAHLCVIYAAMGDWEACEASARKGLENAPDDAVFHLRLGTALSAQARFEESLAALHNAVALDPTLAEAAVALAGVLSQLARPDDAITALENAIDLNPGNYLLLTSLGRTFLQQGSYAAAVTLLNRAIAARPDEGVLYLHRTEALIKLGDASLAVESLIKATFLLLGVDSVGECAQLAYRDFGADLDPTVFGNPTPEPQNFAALVGLGNALRNAGESRGAENAYRKALSLQPASAPVLSRLACHLASQGQYEAASQFLKRLPLGFSGPESVLRLEPAFLAELRAESSGEMSFPKTHGDDETLTVLVSCDPIYFMKFSEPLARSMTDNSGVSCRFRFHVVNADQDCQHHISYLRTRLPTALIEMSEDQQTFPNKYVARTYFACARFLEAPRLLHDSTGPILILDADMITLSKLDPLFKALAGKDVGLFRLDPRRHDPWDQYQGSAMLINRTAQSMRFLRRVAYYIELFRKRGNLQWYLDQAALFAAIACEEMDNPETEFAFFDKHTLRIKDLQIDETNTESIDERVIFWSLLASVPSGRENLSHPVFKQYVSDT